MLTLKIGRIYRFKEGTDTLIFLEENKENYIFWSHEEGKYLNFFHYVIDDWLKNDWLNEVNN